jgi:plasmid stabilization system protein ParE
MKQYTVHFTDEAWDPIEAQVRYIAIEKQAPESASRWLARLLEEIDTLEQMPQRYGLDEYQTRTHGTDVHRMVFERTYLVFYTIDQERSRVDVISFTHGAQESGQL